MSASFVEFIERMFVGPIWPASVLVCLLVAYTAVALLGLIDLDFGVDADLDADAGVDLDAGGAEPGELSGGEPQGDLFGGIGGATLQWLNLQRLPLILWMAVFTVIFWIVSYGLWYGFDVRRYEPTLWTSSLLAVRNVVIAAGATKFATNPLQRLFQPAPSYGPSTLIGESCVVSSRQVNERYGQAEFPTDAAPLLLNIRTDGECLPQGTRVEIIAFDADRRVYKVTAAKGSV